jgi:PAS domain S-box-containing protein
MPDMHGAEKEIKVLHVDDEYDVLALTKNYLEQDAIFNVDTTTSVKEGIELIKNGKYDVVVSDYQMPEMDGLEFLQNLRKLGNEIPFIMLTGKGREEVAMDALNKGANYYILKHGDVESVYRTVARVIKGEVKKKRTEVALRESDAKYRTLVEKIQDGIFILQGTPPRLVYCNEAFAKMVGYTREEAMNLGFDHYVAPEDLKEVAARYLRRQAGNNVFDEYEYRALHKDRKTRVYVNMHVGLIEYQGEIASLGTVKDITDRKQAENALRESEEKYKAVFETTGTAMIIIEEDNTLSLVNAEFEKLSGYSKDDVEGKKRWTEFVAKEDLERLREYYRLRMIDPNAAPARYEARFTDKQGTIQDILSTVGMIPGTKKIVASLLDITERKRAEEQIEAALREKEVLLKEIHHRVKNNLQVISSLFYLQSGYINDKKALEVLKECQNQVKSMAIVHEQMYHSEDLVQIDFADYTQLLVTELFSTYTIDSADIAIKTDIKDVLLDINAAIPCGLIINELLTNALLHAFPEGRKGEIQINMLPNKANEIKLVVRDNGIGIPKDTDFRNTETFGLQLVCGLVEQLEGTIEFDGREGTAFTITFPFGDEQ